MTAMTWIILATLLLTTATLTAGLSSVPNEIESRHNCVAEWMIARVVLLGTAVFLLSLAKYSS